MAISFREYLNCDITDERDVDKMFEYIEHYFTTIYKEGFPSNEMMLLEGIVDKFGKCAKAQGVSNEEIDKLLTDAKDLQNFFFEHGDLNTFEKTHSPSLVSILMKTPRQRVSSVTRQYNTLYRNIYSGIIKIYNLFKDKLISDSSTNILNMVLEIYPKSKNDAYSLINEAIELILGDLSMPKKAKREVIKYLEKALLELSDKNTNWVSFFGSIKETLIIISAFAAVVSAYSDTKQLIEAKEKIEKASEVVEKTTINHIELQNNYYITTSDEIKLLENSNNAASQDIKLLDNQNNPDVHK